jgi:hypothetical protein
MDGTGMACASMTTATYGTYINLPVSWEAKSAINKGTGFVQIWLLSVYNIDASNKITGTTKTCGNKTPPVILNASADMLTNEPAGSEVQNAFPDSSWDPVPASAITGTLGGFKIGASVTIDPTVTLYGVVPTSTLANASTVWPTFGNTIATTDLTTADGGVYTPGSNLPGVTAFPDPNAPFILPKTSLDSTAPSASQLQIILRTALNLYGTSKSCTEETGTAFVTQLNNHVVGCSIANDGGICTSDEYNFIDDNTTQYVPAGGGTFDSKQLSGTATCADVLSAFPAASQ